jgi:PAS domain-containing protein
METRTLLDNLDIGIVAIAPDWTIVEWSAPAARIAGIPADRVLGKGF